MTTATDVVMLGAMACGAKSERLKILAYLRRLVTELSAESKAQEANGKECVQSACEALAYAKLRGYLIEGKHNGAQPCSP